MRVEHVDEVENTVEDSHEEVGKTQIDQIVICNGSHSLMSCNRDEIQLSIRSRLSAKRAANNE